MQKLKLRFSYKSRCVMKIVHIEPSFNGEMPLSKLRLNDFELHGRSYLTVLCSESCVNPLCELYPGLSLIGIDARGFHLTLETDKGLPTRPDIYLKEVYGLQPHELNLQSGFTISDVEYVAKKLNLTKRQNLNVSKAVQILKSAGLC
jgi:hypothetical protein